MNLFQRLKTYILSLYYRFRYPLPAEDSPAQLYIDADGVPWPQHPNYQDADLPDIGQHDIWKKDMRIFLWRTIHGPKQAGAMALEPLGFGRRSEVVPVLFPVGDQLAAQSRKFGFLNLARAAMPEATDEQLRWAYERHEIAVREEARARRERAERHAANWDESRMGYPYQCDTEDQTVSQLTLGSYTPVPGATTLQPLSLLPVNANPPSYTHFTRTKS